MSGKTPSKSKYARHINDQLNINALKHMDEGDETDLVFDADIAALSAILKAIANHHTLVPDAPPFIRAMLRWTWLNYDGKSIREK